MNKYYLFKTNSPFDIKVFNELIKSFYTQKFRLEIVSKTSGYIYATSELGQSLGEVINVIISDLGFKISFVATHKIDEISNFALNNAFIKGINFSSLADVLLILLYDRNDYVKKLLKQAFNEVDHELIFTAEAYLKNDLNAVKAAKTLYLHRNTFNYRLNKFINITQLDIRDYANAFYFNLYLKS